VNVGTVLLGRYQVGDTLGAGGMGTVYQAHDDVLDRDVAIKMLKQELGDDPSTVERFRREALIAARLSHPGIAQVFDFASEDGHWFIIMELLYGQDLHAVLVQKGKLEPALAADIGAQTASALHHAHEQGAVHRDVKPGNIFLTQSGVVKVTDFGIATAAASAPLTATGDVLGTPAYLSPEQVKGRPATPASDIYSLGCVLFELVTGAAPFPGETSLAIAMSRLDQPPPRARSITTDAPPALDSIIAQAMAPEPSDRFDSADQMADALRGGEPTSKTQVLAAGASVGTQVLGMKTKLQAKTASIGRERLLKPIIVGVAAVLLLVLFTKACSGGLITLPNFSGMSISAATAQATKLGLAPQRGPDQLSTQPAGKVFRQDPGTGVKLKHGSKVTLYVSTGIGTAVPSVTQMTLSQAISQLRQGGFLIKLAAAGEDSNALVTNQTPPAGTVAPTGSVVALAIDSASAPTNQSSPVNVPPRTRGKHKGD